MALANNQMKFVISEKPLNERGEGGGTVSLVAPFVFDDGRSFAGMLGARSFAIGSWEATPR